MKHFRHAGRETGVEEISEEIARAHAPEQPLRKLLDEELALKVRQAVEELPTLQREALVLFEYEDFSLAEIAAITGTDTGTIKARLYRARQRLKETLAPYFKKHEAAAALEKH